MLGRLGTKEIDIDGIMDDTNLAPGKTEIRDQIVSHTLGDGDHLISEAICEPHNGLVDRCRQTASQMGGCMDSLADDAWRLDDPGRNDVCTIGTVQEAERYRRR